MEVCDLCLVEHFWLEIIRGNVSSLLSQALPAFPCLYLGYQDYYVIQKIYPGGIRLKKESRKIQSARHIEQHENIFACPICQKDMRVTGLKSIRCEKGHTFDFAKQGYVNFLNQPIHTKYGKDFFEVRKILLSESGFYTPLQHALSEIVADITLGKEEEISILDTGCGEGTYLHHITNHLRRSCAKKVVGVGVDISKEGIIAAARNYDQHIWTVADLANMPFHDKQFTMILSIFSPSNYEEFLRLLKQDGVVIKVVPEKNYLKELRTYLFHSDKKREYSNEEILTRFREHFPHGESKRITYTKTLEQPLLSPFFAMSPLAWSMGGRTT